MTQRVFGNEALLRRILNEPSPPGSNQTAGLPEPRKGDRPPPPQRYDRSEDGPSDDEPPQRIVALGDVAVLDGDDEECARVQTSNVASVVVSDEEFADIARFGSSDGAVRQRESFEDEAQSPPRAAFVVEGLAVDVPLRGAVAHAGPPMGAVMQRRRTALAGLRRRLARELVNGGDRGCGSVGVVIVDEGFSRDYLPDRSRYGGGWQLLAPGPQNSRSRVGRFGDPYRRQHDGHGNMIARNVLDLAPQATLFDAPILPPRVTDVQGYSAGATAVLNAIAQVIENPPSPCLPAMDHWIVVNAWNVPNRFADPLWNTSNPIRYLDNRDHPLNEAVVRLSGVAEVVFAAGNSGEHDPAPDAGPYDRGPYRSIWGANGIEEVTTVGAETVGRRRVTVSSQGPAPSPLLDPSSSQPTNPKPDEHAPSWFAEDTDASVVNTGTSAAAAVWAGQQAARRLGGPSRTS